MVVAGTLTRGSTPVALRIANGRCRLAGAARRYDGLAAFRQGYCEHRATNEQHANGGTRHSGLGGALNRDYHNCCSSTATLSARGGEDTHIRPPHDINLLFVLIPGLSSPTAANKQAALLQEVRGVLADRCKNAKMRADGQVVVVPFQTYAVEVVHAFALENSHYGQILRSPTFRNPQGIDCRP